MEIRRARPEDYETVGRLTVAAYAAYLDADDTVLGSVTSCPEGSPWRELARPGEGEFRMLAVDPAAQGRGVGQGLVTQVVDGFREAGARSIVLCSMTTMTPAHRLYERLGFRRDPALDWSPVPDVVLVAFRLGLEG